MAGDWIKMRPSLMTSPKVNGIARYLETRQGVSRALTTGFNGSMSEVVTRNVMRNVTIASLLIIWGAANEHTSDGIFVNADLSDIDDMVGIPGFGEAMESVGWAKYDDETQSVILPNFNEYNTCGQDRAKEKNADRQRRYRNNHKHERNAENNVTCNVTNNDREEKRREEEKKNPPNGGLAPGLPGTPAAPHQEIIAAYHEILPACPTVREWNNTRRKYLQSRWRENPERQSLEWWKKFFRYVSRSDFLAGRIPGRNNGPPFVADLEWLIKPSNFAKVIEGRYHADGQSTSQH